MKNICALLVVVQLATASFAARAQETGLGDGLGSDLPPAMEFSADVGASAAPSSGEGDGLTPQAEPIAVGDADLELFDGSILGEPMRMLQCTPLFESSGTWLRRGFWFGEVDFWMVSRSWDKHGLTLASEEAIRTTHPLSNGYIVSNTLNIEGHSPGAEGMGRVKLGRFLFRDSRNRDHFLEAAWWGGGSFEQAVSLESATAAATTNPGLQVSNFIDRVNISFDGAEQMDYFYKNQTNTIEVNYEVRQRMDRDQLLLQPNGEWVRTANATKTLSFLAGIRYLNLRELLDWNSTNNSNTAVDESGFYNVATENNMLGPQLGGSISHEAARWSLSLSGKAGAYWNRIDLNSRFQVGTDAIRNSGLTNSEEDDLSFIGEVETLAKWHLRPNVSLRAGMGLFLVESVALAPHQVNFIPGGFAPIANGGDSVFVGGSLGIESYW